MNIIKLGLLLLTGLGFGYGIDELIKAEDIENDNQNNYSDFSTGYCHQDEFFLEHLKEGLSEDERILVETKIDELLLNYEVTLEELVKDYELRHDFMIELMDFLEENNIDYHNHFGDDEWHHGMGMH